MKRRDLLKGIGLTSLGLTGLHPQVQAAEMFLPEGKKKKKEPEQFGRTDYETERDAKLAKEQFFNDHELQLITVLSDIIIPRDAKSGSASESGVTNFIEFMVKDRPDLQTPLRGGLTWVDVQAKRRFDNPFLACTRPQQLEIVEDIAYPSRKKPGMSQGIAFFSLLRNLVASGFWSSQMGISDLGYLGNTPNKWEGVPDDVLKQYGLQ